MLAAPTPVGLLAPCLRFTLTHGKVNHGLVLSLGEVSFIGRASRSTVVVDDISVSSQHVELSLAVAGGDAAEGSSRLVLRARDCSQNGTGVVDPGPNGAPGDTNSVRRLSCRKPEDLLDGAAIVVPLRRKGQHGRLEADTQNLFYVRLCPNTPEPPADLLEQCPGLPAPFPADLVPEPLANVPARSRTEVSAEALAETPCPPAMRLSKPVLEGAALLPDCFDAVSGSGRWHYVSRLGEGGLGSVYHAVDCKGSLGEVAIKVLKFHERANWGKQHAFAMHRESQWSIHQLHNTKDPRYDNEAAVLFARYLEDHTGFELEGMGPKEFDERRRLFEAPDFDWEREVPPLTSTPYVVMELCLGEALHLAIDRERRRPSARGSRRPEKDGMSSAEKREVFLQAARALEYLEAFGLIHRDFRGCNMHVERTPAGSCQLKVLDLGVMICAEDGQQWNTNQAVQAFRRRGETEEKRRRYDWLPWEVRAGADGSGPAVNFSPPTHSFDVFSLGVLALHLLLGRTAARAALENLRTSGRISDTSALGVNSTLVPRMLGDACNRPHPSEVVRALQGQMPVELARGESRQLECSPSSDKPPRASRSRSRDDDKPPKEQSSGSGSCIQTDIEAMPEAEQLSKSTRPAKPWGSFSRSRSRSRSRERKPVSEPQPEPQPSLAPRSVSAPPQALLPGQVVQQGTEVQRSSVPEQLQDLLQAFRPPGQQGPAANVQHLGFDQVAAGQQGEAVPVHEQLQELLQAFKPRDQLVQPVRLHGEDLSMRRGQPDKQLEALRPPAQSAERTRIEVASADPRARQPQQPCGHGGAAALGDKAARSATRSTGSADCSCLEDTLSDLGRILDLGEQKEFSERCARPSEYWLLTYPLAAASR